MKKKLRNIGAIIGLIAMCLCWYWYSWKLVLVIMLAMTGNNIERSNR